MQIWNVLRAARWKYRTQKSRQKSQLATIAQLCRAISSQLRHVSTIGKKVLSSNMSSICPHNMVNFGPIATETGLPVWAPLQIWMAFASWQRYCTASSSGRQPNFAALNRGRHLCSAGRPSRWALAHISSSLRISFTDEHSDRIFWTNRMFLNFSSFWLLILLRYFSGSASHESWSGRVKMTITFWFFLNGRYMFVYQFGFRPYFVRISSILLHHFRLHICLF